MQQQIKFEAMPFQSTVRIPDSIPEGLSFELFCHLMMKKPKTQNKTIGKIY
jgi:hypothetical protein